MSDYIALWLEGPLQSWGHDSHFDIRDTLPFPTWSGVIGLLCCAMGKGGEQRELIKKLTVNPPLMLTFEHKYPSTVLRDYHVVGGGYDKEDHFELLMIPKKSDGTQPTKVSGTIVTTRYAMQDLAAAVILSFEKKMADEIEGALMRPYWQIYLGRKAYTPTEPVLLGRFSSEKEAEQAINSKRIDKGLVLNRKIVDGRQDDADEVLQVFDVPINFGRHKNYASRYVSIYSNFGEN